MKLEEYSQLDAVALSEAIASGEASAAEVLDAARAAIEAVQPTLNALVGPMLADPPSYREDGRFAGVPFAVKDIGIHVGGVASSGGSRLATGFVSPHDSDLVRRWRRAGLAIVARTATPEFGACLTTEPVATGATRNPWDPDLSPGGSSGGAAAIVASGALPMAHANDSAGSIRVPAAMCGLVGLKPSRGRVPPGPDFDEPLNGLTSEFAVTRTVRDCAALLDEVYGSEPGDRYFFERGTDSFASTLSECSSRYLRIGVAPMLSDAEDENLAEVSRIAALLEHHGHDVVPAEWPTDLDELVAVNVPLWGASIASTVKELSDEPLEHLRPVLERSTFALAEHGWNIGWEAVAQARACQNSITRRTARMWGEFDLVLTPVLGRSHWRVGELRADDATDAEAWLRTLLGIVPYASVVNVTGRPAISVPTGSAGGRPVGVQFIAPQGAEADLISVAGQLESITPWADRRPMVHAGARAGSGRSPR